MNEKMEKAKNNQITCLLYKFVLVVVFLIAARQKSGKCEGCNLKLTTSLSSGEQKVFLEFFFPLEMLFKWLVCGG